MGQGFPHDSSPMTHDRFFGGETVSTEATGSTSRAEVVRRPRKTPDKTIRAKEMVKGIAPVVPLKAPVVPMALAA